MIPDPNANASGETAPGALHDAYLAVRLLALAPQALGGIALRGGGPARDLVIDALRAHVPPEQPWRRLPGHIDDDRLTGGTDVAASLAAGRVVHQRGLMAEVAGGVLSVPMAERLREDLSGRLAQALDNAASTGAGFTLILLDDGVETDERPPLSLLERIAFECDLSGLRALVDAPAFGESAIALEAVAPLPDDALMILAATAEALGVASIRPLLFAGVTARAHAALAGRTSVELPDLEAAARLVLAPRATRLPPEPESEGDQPPPPSDKDEPRQNDDPQDQQQDGAPPEDRVLEAAQAAIPRDVLDQIASGRAMRSARGGGTGRRTGSKLRGRPLSARPGMPGGGVRLALVDTLRAAIPWQPIRQREPSVREGGMIRFRRDDLRVRRFEERSTTVTVFCVDASGSAAVARLAEAKGAVELILAAAYVKRTEVALIAFRGSGADVLLPPTRSLTRAKRALAELPGGGGTPLATGITLARQLGEAITSRGRTPMFVFLTDGSANIAADGTPGRPQAREDALAAARGMAAAGCDALVIDISPRPRPDAEQLAEAMRARYLPLPMADARKLQAALVTAQPEPRPAQRARR
ncbi:magnesium chelatase [Novosphingobium sp. AAP83]|uniref:magnesium chelatase subunit D n=1 Tax=Novosphingobium sp. AAP83 TaxID=1523425 RepID=UPI0006B8DA73|nr:magnesium chelatase subunit D [Novosphingobium sp. AAP83]KPF93624.1 magnesium chelatase [Novosphingobium sp. AAP83]